MITFLFLLLSLIFPFSSMSKILSQLFTFLTCTKWLTKTIIISLWSFNSHEFYKAPIYFFGAFIAFCKQIGFLKWHINPHIPRAITVGWWLNIIIFKIYILSIFCSISFPDESSVLIRSEYSPGTLHLPDVLLVYTAEFGFPSILPEISCLLDVHYYIRIFHIVCYLMTQNKQEDIIF